MPDLRLVALVVLLAGAAGAEDDTALQRILEMPAQRLLMDVVSRPGARLSDFATDGCSGGLSETWQVVADLFPGFAQAQGNLPPWEDCCVTHDRAYHDAGDAREAGASYAARLTADRTLRACVVATGEGRIQTLADRYRVGPDQVRRAYAAIAEAMFVSVRFGGGPCTGLPWRWGYGWPGCMLPRP